MRVTLRTTPVRQSHAWQFRHPPGVCRLSFCCAILVLALTSPALPESRYVRNGSLSQKGSLLKDADIKKLRDDGWACPDASQWPIGWGGLGAKMKVECPTSGGKTNDPFFRISGKDGLVSGYFGHPFQQPTYVLTVWARGHGTLNIGVIAYQLSDDRKKVVGQVFSIPPLQVKVDSDEWVRYRHLLRKGDIEVTVHPVFSAPAGAVDFDEVDIVPSNPALDLMVEEEGRLYGTGALVENLYYAEADDGFAGRLEEYEVAAKAFEKNAASAEPKAVESIRETIKGIDPYVLRQDLKTLQVTQYNEMLVLTRVLMRLAGQSWNPPERIVAAGVKPVADIRKPGERKPRPETITVVDIRSNKVLYEENEHAVTRARLVNTASAERKGRLVAVMHLDMDTQRKLSETNLTLGPGETRTWEFGYGVGPETYGRGVEVRFENEQGEAVDQWQEFYAVAAEFFRVQTHSYNAQNELYEVSPWTTYLNQRHYFASEPTDFGVQPFAAEEYLSGQAGYRFQQAARQAEIDHFRSLGTRITFYQTFAFCGQMGYEVLREHPEYALYDANGQLAVDPIYGGYPNPMELASPIEVGPKRNAQQPYLDRKYTPWQHCPANLALEEAVAFQAECVKAYAKQHRFDGIYVDGNMGVLKGYGYDGVPNVPSGKPEDFARLNARNHRIFSEIVKQDKPNFGTWYNWGYASIQWAISVGLTSVYGTGSGLPGDTTDENIRAATGWKNVMILDETGGGLFHTKTEELGPQRLLRRLIAQRDYAMQKWQANTIIGYSDLPVIAEKPGPSRWAWPTANYFGAQLLATQMHVASAFWPSLRPTLQFQTRYSRFLWAPDVKVVTEPRKVLTVRAPDDVWWEDLVYQRKTEDGYDLIVHLVRKPPTRQWDIDLADEPAEVEETKIVAAVPAGDVKSVTALRPYYYEEDQQPVQTRLSPTETPGGIRVDLPPFRYHTMVVFRVQGSD